MHMVYDKGHNSGSVRAQLSLGGLEESQGQALGGVLPSIYRPPSLKLVLLKEKHDLSVRNCTNQSDFMFLFH